MDKFVVNGGTPLRGVIEVGGMKNSALGILFGTILTNDICIIENLPPVSDIVNSLKILEACAKIKMLSRTSAEIDTRAVQPCRAPYEMARKMRASYYVLGAELGRFGKTKSAYPGGCDFGVRPIDQHIKGFEALGATVYQDEKFVYAEAPNGLKGNSIYFDIVSVGDQIQIQGLFWTGTVYLGQNEPQGHIAVARLGNVTQDYYTVFGQLSHSVGDGTAGLLQNYSQQTVGAEKVCVIGIPYGG